MMQALVMCARELTQAHAKQRTSQQYSSNYSPEVEIESAFKENIVRNSFINRNIALPFFKDNRGCKLVRENKSIALKFTHAQIAILANSYSKTSLLSIKMVNFHLDFLAFPSVKFPKNWHRGFKTFALIRARFPQKLIRQVFTQWQKPQICKMQRICLCNPYLFCS